MQRTAAVSVLGWVLLAACSASAPDETAAGLEPTAPVSSTQEQASIVEPAPQTKANLKSADATGYFVPGMQLPAAVSLEPGKVARDSYGHPWTYERLGDTLPAFSGRTTEDEVFNSEDLRGRWTVIEVWGIWCHDSMRDAKYAAALATALDQDPAIDFLTVHTPQNAAKADQATKSYDSVADWLSEKGDSFKTLVDTDASLRDALSIRWTPTYLVISPDLTVEGFRTGLADAGDHAVKTFVRDISETRADWTARQGR